MKTTFDINFDFNQSFKQDEYTKMETKRSCQLIKLLFNLLSTCKNLNKKVIFIILILSPTTVLDLQRIQTSKMDCKCFFKWHYICRLKSWAFYLIFFPLNLSQIKDELSLFIYRNACYCSMLWLIFKKYYDFFFYESHLNIWNIIFLIKVLKT